MDAIMMMMSRELPAARARSFGLLQLYLRENYFYVPFYVLYSKY
jgi:hypothetical protein